MDRLEDGPPMDGGSVGRRGQEGGQRSLHVYQCRPKRSSLKVRTRIQTAAANDGWTHVPQLQRSRVVLKEGWVGEAGLASGGTVGLSPNEGRSRERGRVRVLPEREAGAPSDERIRCTVL